MIIKQTIWMGNDEKMRKMKRKNEENDREMREQTMEQGSENKKMITEEQE